MAFHVFDMIVEQGVKHEAGHFEHFSSYLDTLLPYICFRNFQDSLRVDYLLNRRCWNRISHSFVYLPAVLLTWFFTEEVLQPRRGTFLQSGRFMGLLRRMERVWGRCALGVEWWRKRSPILRAISVCHWTVHSAITAARFTYWIQVLVIEHPNRYKDLYIHRLWCCGF